MRLPVLVVDVVDVVGGDDFEAEFGGDPQQVGDDAALFLDAVVHQLDDEVVLAEDVDELGGCGSCLVEFAFQ